MKILVTGANGYLGRGVVKSLLDKGNQVIATDLSVDCVDKRAVAVASDLFEIEAPYEYFGKPDVLLHMAWRDVFVHFSDTHIDDLPKHYMFIKKMVSSKISRIAVLGSMHEVGFFEGSITEDTPCHPTTPYGISKNALKDLTQMLAKQEEIEFQWLRGYYIVSNSVYGNSIFSKIAAAAQAGEKEFPCTMGQKQFDFIDYADFCEQVALTVSQNKITGIINICSGKPEKLADRVERFVYENGYDISLKYGALPDRPYDSKAVWGNPKKIQLILSEE